MSLHLLPFQAKEISVGVNNAMVLNNDLTLTERKLKFLLFSMVYVSDRHSYMK